MDAEASLKTAIVLHDNKVPDAAGQDDDQLQPFVRVEKSGVTAAITMGAPHMAIGLSKTLHIAAEGSHLS